MEVVEKPIISIVTRAYNVEKYISDCVESVLRQSFGNFEWIILENGSTDKTREILEEYAKKDKRICLLLNDENYIELRKSEKGYYSYFDMLNITQGKYITDLDSDDILHSDYLKCLYEATRGKDIDIVAAGSAHFYNDNLKEIRRVVVPREFKNSDITEMGNNFLDFYFVFGTVWGKLILRKFYMDNLEYIFHRPFQLVYGGDTHTCLRMLQLAKSCICIKKPLYFYRCRTGSISAYYYQDRYKCHDAIFAEGIRLLKIWNKNTQENFLNICLRHFEGMQKELQLIADAEKMNIKEKLRMIEKIMEDSIYVEYIEFFNDEVKKEWEDMRYRILGKIYEEGLAKDDKSIWNYFCYTFGKEFIARKSISEGKYNKFDIMLYMVAAGSKNNAAIYQNELLKLCIKYITGKNCSTIFEMKKVIQQYIKTSSCECEKKLKISELLERGEFEAVEKEVEKFSKEMILDCDLLFAKACCFYERNDKRNALVVLAIANELYPEESVLTEYIDSIIQEI